MEALCVFRGLSCATAWTPQWRCDSRAFRHAEETQFAPLTWHNLSMCGLECVEDTWWNSLLALLVIPLGPSGDPTLSTAEFRWSAALQREAVLDDILQTLRLPGKFISSLVPKRKKTEKKSQGTQRASPFSWSEPLEVGGVVEAAAASVWTWGGIKYSFSADGEKGGWRVRGRCCLVAEGEHEKMVWTRAGLEESRGCRRPPCRRGDGQLTPLLGSVFTCGSPGCWGGRGTSALFQCLTSHLAETGRVTSHTLSLQIHWYMEEVSALTAALDNDSAFVIVSHGGYHKY